MAALAYLVVTQLGEHQPGAVLTRDDLAGVDVDRLLSLGVIEPTGPFAFADAIDLGEFDAWKRRATDAEAALAPFRARNNELATQVDALTKERDQAKSAVATVENERDQAKNALMAAEKERDQTKSTLDTTAKERDEAKAELDRVGRERDALYATIEAIIPTSGRALEAATVEQLQAIARHKGIDPIPEAKPDLIAALKPGEG